VNAAKNRGFALDGAGPEENVPSGSQTPKGSSLRQPAVMWELMQILNSERVNPLDRLRTLTTMSDSLSNYLRSRRAIIIKALYEHQKKIAA
jgi:hypothetical protein